jgi:anti-sigma B factor antagonist
VATSSSTQPVTSFSVDASSANRQTTLVCSGKLIVSSAEQMLAEARRWIECSSSIVVDVAGLTYLDSAGLGALVASYTSAKKVGCEFRLLNVTPRVMHLLQLTNLDKVLQPTTDNLL